MCGINGIFSSCQRNDLNKRITKMNSVLSHRGPDAEGISIINNYTAFGHRRLSILDLNERSNQPMYSNNKNSLIVFNGEIFNYKIIKKKLKGLYDFVTNSDTEVILASVETKGIEWLLKQANGMFAFAIYNFKTSELILARDRFGIKPLFYSITNDTLVFSSEIKGLLNSGLIKAEFNNLAVDEYLANRYVREPYTFFNNIYQLDSSSYITFTSFNKFIKRKYWELPLLNFDTSYNEKAIIEQTSIEVEKAIKRWLISDVKVGAYLSGGVDSSLTTAILSKYSNKQINTYTIGFKEEEFNEFKFSKIVADIYDTKHHELLIDSNGYLSEWERLIQYKDAPLAVPNEIPLAIMSTSLSEDITVVISGEGADELFGGYGRIFRSAFDFKNHETDYSSYYNYFISEYEYVNRTIRDKFLSVNKDYRDYFDDKISKDFENYSDNENVFRFFHNYHIKGLLNRVDMTTMQTSVEARPPFLDHELIEFVYKNIPYELKLKWKDHNSEKKAKKMYAKQYSEKLDIPKYILKEVSKKFLPNNIIYRKKMGFPVPLSIWFGDLKNISIDLLSNTDWLKNGVINNLCENVETSDRAGQLLWMFLNIELFKRKYFKTEWHW